MMHPETMAWGMGAAMADAIMSAGRNVAQARNARALHAWSDALANAQGDADDMAAVAVAAINAMADLEEENAVLRRALRQREEALRNLRQ
jgi:hypothetical protein